MESQDSFGSSLAMTEIRPESFTHFLSSYNLNIVFFVKNLNLASLGLDVYNCIVVIYLA